MERTNNQRTILYIVAASIIAIYLIFFLSNSYSSDGITGTIVDPKHGSPIKGAIVVVQWELLKPRFFHGHNYKTIHIVETITDEKGNFVIPPWGPKFPGIRWRLVKLAPHGYIFAKGFSPKSLSSFEIAFDGYPQEMGGPFDKTHFARISNEKRRNLEPMQKDLVKYARYIDSISREFYRDKENWHRTPNMYVFIYNEQIRLKALGVKQNLYFNLDRIDPKHREKIKQMAVIKTLK